MPEDQQMLFSHRYLLQYLRLDRAYSDADGLDSRINDPSDSFTASRGATTALETPGRSVTESNSRLQNRHLMLQVGLTGK